MTADQKWALEKSKEMFGRYAAVAFNDRPILRNYIAATLLRAKSEWSVDSPESRRLMKEAEELEKIYGTD